MQAEGKKFDTGKEPVFEGLIQYFPRALIAIADVSRYGKEKYELQYDDVNWSRVERGYARYSNALGRHIFREFIDGLVDPESGLLHASHAGWNSLARLEFLLREIESGTRG